LISIGTDVENVSNALTALTEIHDCANLYGIAEKTTKGEVANEKPVI
jgi:hypothetical protein